MHLSSLSPISVTSLATLANDLSIGNKLRLMISPALHGLIAHKTDAPYLNASLANDS